VCQFDTSWQSDPPSKSITRVDQVFGRPIWRTVDRIADGSPELVNHHVYQRYEDTPAIVAWAAWVAYSMQWRERGSLPDTGTYLNTRIGAKTPHDEGARGLASTARRILRSRSSRRSIACKCEEHSFGASSRSPGRTPKHEVAQTDRFRLTRQRIGRLRAERGTTDASPSDEERTMWRRVGVRTGETAGFGVVAGIVFALVEIAGAAMRGMPATTPLRMFGSVVLGRSALDTGGTSVVVGSLAHLALSAVLGAIYGVLNEAIPQRMREGWSEQVLIGALYGTLVWFVNFQIVARIGYPWFLDSPQGLQWAMHALFFGVPLGLMYAASTHRVRSGGT
jgi:hypothetical protein